MAVVVLLIFTVYLYVPYNGKGSLEVTEPAPLFKFSDESLQRGELTLEPVSPDFFDGIQTFWDRWSKVFYDDRPSTKAVRLGSRAQALSIKSGDDSARTPPSNRIRNSDSDIFSLRDSHAALLETLNSEHVAGDMFNGTGVVTVGGGEYFGPAIIGLHMLRKTGCTIPVEIFVADAKEYEPALCEDYLARFGARCHVIADFLHGRNTTPSFEVTHYQLKSLAILFSSFAEVLYLDSDSIPLVDPSTELFTTEPYKSSGLVIWPDFWISTESPLFYTIAGLPQFPSNLPKSSSEAGQILINKRTHLKSLLLAIYYNIYGPDHYYPLLSQGVLGQGDKETFMAAALVLEQPYYRVKTGVIAVSRRDGRATKGSAMVQHNPSDDLRHIGGQDASGNGKAKVKVRPAFLHANTPKMNAGHLVDEGDLFTANGKKRLRLWGSQKEQEQQFGYDLEKEVWKLLLHTGCELKDIIAEWKGRKNMCGRLEAHFKAVF